MKKNIEHLEKLFTKMIKILLACTFIFSLGFSETKINSLGEINNAIKHKEGQTFLDEQLRGVKSKSPFNTQLPKWITSKQLHDTFTMKYTMNKNALLGLKSWRTKESTFVGIGCYEDELREKEKPYCGDYRANTKVYLSLLEHKKNAEGYKVLARTERELKLIVSWKNSQLSGGVEEEFDKSNPTRYIRFDFAPYKIKKETYAFGLRVGWQEGYSGGGASFEALVLFEKQGEKLVSIFSEPMYSFSDLAGEWNDDGTREHHISEGKNIVIVLKTMHNGYYDLKVKGLESKFSKVFVFDKLKNTYVVK